MRKLIYNITTVGLLSLLCIFLNNSCTEYNAPDMIEMDGFDSDSAISTIIHRKVLWVNIDGAVGSVVKKAMPQDGNIAKMLKNSKYSWIGLSENRILSEVKAEDPITWSTMLTGVIPEKHHVTDDSYAANMEYDPSNPDEKVIQYPNILQQISENTQNNPTLCVTPWAKLNENMLYAAQRTITTANDAESKEVIIEHLKNSNFDFTLVSFSGMLEAGKNGGFTDGNTDYVEALKKIDNYLGEVLQTIGERENTFYEDWLIVVTSNHGGTVDGSYGGNTDEERNTFGIFYYPHYEEQLMKGEKLYGAYIENLKTQAMVFDTVSADVRYGLGPDTPFSMEIVMRMLPKKDGRYEGGNWHSIITKGNPGSTGWGLFRQRQTASFRIGGLGSSEAIEKAVTGFNDPQWHNYGFSITKMDGRRNWTTAFDGKGLGEGSSATRGVLDDVSPLIIGGGVPTPYYVSEVRLWKKTLTVSDFAEQAALLNLAPTDSKFSDLLAYWRFAPSEVKEVRKDTVIIRNQLEGGLDMYYINLDKEDSRPLDKRGLVELANTLPIYQKTGDLVMENTLVMPQILYWLNIGTNTVLDGFKFIDNYRYSEDWRDMPEE